MIFAAALAAGLLSGPLTIGTGSLPNCNAQLAGEYDERQRTIAARPPADPNLEFVLLQKVIDDIAREQEVLQSTCTEQDAAPIDSQLHATSANAYVLQAELARARYQKSCPAAADPVAQGFLAQAWREVELGMPDHGMPAHFLTNAADGVSKRAAALEMKLPQLLDATNYWMTTVQMAGSRAVEACPK